MSTQLGIIIVTYNSAGDILACLGGLGTAHNVAMEVVVVDNGSTDNTCQLVRAWTPPANLSLTLVPSGRNAGFAAGVNIGLRHLLDHPNLDRFWILNPDGVSTPGTPDALARHPMPFSLLGCRITYAAPLGQIQIDGGTVSRWTGATRNVNLGKPAQDTPAPDPAGFDFISGASMVASRRFVEAAGPMPEQYFLYYEEVDWAARRGPLPLAYCDGAQVAHAAGASIGSPTLSRGPSELSSYFKHRARLRYVARFHPAALPAAYLFGVLKIAQSLGRRQFRSAIGAARALHGLPPSRAVKAAICAAPQVSAKSRTAQIKLS